MTEFVHIPLPVHLPCGRIVPPGDYAVERHFEHIRGALRRTGVAVEVNNFLADPGSVNRRILAGPPAIRSVILLDEGQYEICKEYEPNF